MCVHALLALYMGKQHNHCYKIFSLGSTLLYMESSVIDIIGEQSRLGVQMPNIVMFANCQHDIICQCK
jgi:hypothetical protein